MEGQPPPQPSAEMPSEEELRAQIEEQLRTVRVQDLVTESAASIVNLTARRIAKEDEQDLEQARVGIEAVRALVELLEGEVATQVRSALSELQLLYARASKGEPLGGPEEQAEQSPPVPPAPDEPKPQSGLWVPGRGD